MEPKQTIKVKAKRQKKRKSRTEVSSSSDGDSEPSPTPSQKPTQKQPKEEKAPKGLNDSEVSESFTKYYLQRATEEFSEDLDKIRGADDFNAEAVPVLIHALKQGTGLFSVEEQRRVVNSGEKKVEEE